MKLLDHEEMVEFLLRAWPFLPILGIMLVIEWSLSLSGRVLAYLTLTALLSGNRMFPDALLLYIMNVAR